jgi:phosphatidylglycerophosphate synthase
MLDGILAIKAGEASSWGEVVNELPDRISDVVFFTGLAHTAWANTVLTYWVIIGMLVMTYVGILGKAVGAHRQFGGLMPRPVRMNVLAVACVVQFVTARSPDSPAVAFGLSVFDMASVVIIAGLLQTTVSRTPRIYVTLAWRTTSMTTSSAEVQRDGSTIE